MASKICVIVGKRNVGKSTLIKDLAEGLNDKSLIIDPGQSKAYKNHGFIKPSQIPHFKIKHGKIKRISNVINKKALLAQIFGFDIKTNKINMDQAFRNGNLFLDDAASYLNSSLNENLRECIKAVKQYNLNLFVCYHAIKEISTEILRLGPDTIFLKKTNDKTLFSRIPKAQDLGTYYPLMQAYYRVRFKGLTVDQIERSAPKRELVKIADELELTYGKNPNWAAKSICIFANGSTKVSAQLAQEGQYYYEKVDLR